MVKACAPALAKMLAEWFPDLGGRAVAVTDADLTKENLPALPIVFVALDKEAASGGRGGGASRIEIEEALLVEFWLPVARHKSADGGESAYWSWYDYDALRDILIHNLRQWRSPRGGYVQYRSLEIEATNLAVAITFRVLHCFSWCPVDIELDAGDGPAYVVARICPAPSVVCEQIEEQKEEPDPCRPSM